MLWSGFTAYIYKIQGPDVEGYVVVCESISVVWMHLEMVACRTECEEAVAGGVLTSSC